MRDDQTGLGEFYERGKKNLQRYIRSRLRCACEMDAVDILQDIFVNLFNMADISGHVENLAAYVYASIRNRLADRARARKNCASLDQTPEGELLGAFSPVSLADDPAKAAEAAQIRRKLIEAIDALEPRQRAVFVATQIRGVSFKELSLRWNEPVGTLLARKSRAVK